MEEELDIRQIMRLLLRRWKLIAVIVILAVLASAAFTHYTYVPRYKTTYTLIVMIRTEQVRYDQIYDVRLSRDMVETIERFATSRLVLDEVIEQVGHELGYGALRENIEIEQYAGAEFLEIAVTDTDPARAVGTTNELAAVLVDQLVDYMEVNNVRLVDAAATAELIPPEPS